MQTNRPNKLAAPPTTFAQRSRLVLYIVIGAVLLWWLLPRLGKPVLERSESTRFKERNEVGVPSTH